MVPESEGEVYLLLVTANVLRLRRQYALAQAKCSEVLEQEPDNAAAYSVLGSIALSLIHISEPTRPY